jgi:transposase InsO family protein
MPADPMQEGKAVSHNTNLPQTEGLRPRAPDVAMETTIILAGRKIIYSMFAMGSCSDNAMMENLYPTFKIKLVLDDDAPVLQSRKQPQRQQAFWIDRYCNCERQHSRIGYRSPMGYVQEFITARTLTSCTARYQRRNHYQGR